MKWWAAALIFCVWVSSAQAQTADDQTYMALAAALTKLAAAVDAYVAASQDAAELPTQQLLQKATAHDRGLVAPFRDYMLRTRVAGRDSSVLVCTEDGKRALIEDAGCTARSDSQRWRILPLSGCTFSLNLLRVCHPLTEGSR